MTEKEVKSALKRAGFHEALSIKHAAWLPFVRAMKGRQYGSSETLDAWLWFASGWDAVP